MTLQKVRPVLPMNFISSTYIAENPEVQERRMSCIGLKTTANNTHTFTFNQPGDIGNINKASKHSLRFSDFSDFHRRIDDNSESESENDDPTIYFH